MKRKLELSVREQRKKVAKALGILVVYGPDAPQATRDFLDYALRKRLCTQDQINNAEIKHNRDYQENPCDRIFR